MKDRDRSAPVQELHETDAPLHRQVARGIGTLLLVTAGVLLFGYLTAVVVSWLY